MIKSEQQEPPEVVEEYIGGLKIEKRNAFLVKVPEWLGEKILGLASGTEIGESSTLQPGAVAQLQISSSIAGDKPSDFNLSLSHAVVPGNTFSFCTADSQATALPLRQAYHAIPARTASYKSLTKDRATAAASAAVASRTIIDDRDALTASNQQVQMFRLAQEPAASPTAKRSKTGAIQSLPHHARAGAQPTNNEELIMRILVSDDTGWNLQNFAKKFKESGGTSLNQAQLKQKLSEICDYIRREDDSHPKYYLKVEYK